MLPRMFNVVDRAARYDQNLPIELISYQRLTRLIVTHIFSAPCKLGPCLCGCKLPSRLASSQMQVCAAAASFRLCDSPSPHGVCHAQHPSLVPWFLMTWIHASAVKLACGLVSLLWSPMCQTQIIQKCFVSVVHVQVPPARAAAWNDAKRHPGDCEIFGDRP